MSVEYVKKRVPISTHKYLCGTDTKESVQDIPMQIKQQKKPIAETNVEDIMGSFNVKSFGQNCENTFP